MSNIVCLNIKELRAVTDDGQILAVIKLLDAWGDEVEQSENPVTFIAGPTKAGTFLVDLIGSFEQQADN